ncbi:MAG: helix-turn-helix transcriptional regulator [Bacteroidia bacterium]|nr:helix-turn-helix transcriptional regulator [Bacteroidia bacterium]
MKLYIKYMVSHRCKMVVKEELQKLGLHPYHVELGAVNLPGELSDDQKKQIAEALKRTGLELLEDRRSILIEKIKSTIIEMIHLSEDQPKINFSVYLSDKLNYDYTYLSNLFSESEGTTIERYILLHKIEKVKELIIYGELNFTEIAFRLHYSSVAHLSNQFKKITGLTPSFFRSLKHKRRNQLENV